MHIKRRFSAVDQDNLSRYKVLLVVKISEQIELLRIMIYMIRIYIYWPFCGKICL